MKVALDASPLVEATGGIGRYTRQLAAALAAEFPDDEVELMTPKPGRWWSIGLPLELKRGGYSVFHGTDFAVPYLPSTAASVMTIHDLSPWRVEWRSETANRVRRRTPWLLRLGLARMVITPTEAVRREAISHFGLRPDAVRAVPHGVEPRFKPNEAALDSSNYLLIVATQGKRKNIQTAEAAARAAGLELRVAGRGEWPAAGVADGVRYLGAAGEEDLPTLYRGALAVLCPSHYEGFGLTLLEAMACGAPVIASTDAALMEVAGGAAIHCEAGDARAWREAIEAVAADGERRAAMRKRGLERAASFTWARTARMTRAVYEEALATGERRKR